MTISFELSMMTDALLVDSRSMVWNFYMLKLFVDRWSLDMWGELEELNWVQHQKRLASF